MENTSCKKICRFCLETPDSNFETIEEVTFAKLDFLWLKVNLSISEQPVMCRGCVKTIKIISDFKTKCLELENYIMACVKDKGRIKIDLRKVYVNKTPVENIINLSEEHIVCRLCLELVKNDSVVFLRNQTDIVQKLEQNFPEVDLTCTDDPVICASCQVSLQCHFSFINTCLTAEEKIMEYCKVEGTNSMGQIDLNSVIHFISKGSLKCKFEAEAVKIEEMCNEVSENTSYSVEMKKEEIFHTELDIKEDSSAQESELTNKNSQQQVTLIHMEESKIKMHKCEACSFATKRKGTFRKHLLSHGDTSDVVTRGTAYKYKCHMCDFEVKRKGNLKWHMLTHKTHAEIITYKCDLCDHKTKRKPDLKGHMLVHMDVSEIEMHKCELCPFKTKWYSSFRNHMRIHTKAAGVVTAGTIRKCDLCDFETKWRESLRKHMLIHKTHSEISTYKCDLCSYEAKLKDYLKGHMLTHKTTSEITMYKCHQCKYETKRKFDLKRHVRTHKNHTSVKTQKRRRRRKVVV